MSTQQNILKIAQFHIGEAERDGESRLTDDLTLVSTYSLEKSRPYARDTNPLRDFDFSGAYYWVIVNGMKEGFVPYPINGAFGVEDGLARFLIHVDLTEFSNKKGA